MTELTQQKNFIALLSGGLDSSVAVATEVQRGGKGLILFFDYGQRAVKRERKASQVLAKHFGLEFRSVSLPFLAEITKTALVMNDQVIPQIGLDKLDNRDAALKSAQEVWVPNRNGLFLNIAACFAEALGIQKILVGFNAEEALTFPDNSANFVNKAQEFFRLSTLSGLEVLAPTLGMNKSEIVQRGLELKVPFEKTWSCYQAGRKQCGQCESCLRSLRAYHVSGILQRMIPYFDSVNTQIFKGVSLDAYPMA